MSKSAKLTLIPVMLCFFAMGFVDMVGIASNYVKEDLNLNDATANMFPSLVFFWFLRFPVFAHRHFVFLSADAHHRVFRILVVESLYHRQLSCRPPSWQ